MVFVCVGREACWSRGETAGGREGDGGGFGGRGAEETGRAYDCALGVE